jgi:hypothetical protein
LQHPQLQRGLFSSRRAALADSQRHHPARVQRGQPSLACVHDLREDLFEFAGNIMSLMPTVTTVSLIPAAVP